MDWMLLPLKRYADFDGRSRRKEYWMFTLLSVIVYSVCLAIMLAGMPWSDLAAADSGQQMNEPPGVLFWVGLVPAVIWGLGTLIPGIAVTVRRFHDQDKSGWMYLLSFIPYVGGIILLVFMCLDGTRGPNRFGDDPKGGSTADIFN
jgi:uncharacterized membrane protein YhaH (DUF805 family)